MSYLKRLRARHYAWASVLAVAGVWWPLFIITTPPEFLQVSVNPGILNFCMAVACFGAFVKIGGYLASQMPDKAGVIGVSVELAGLILAVVGPLSYILISFSASINDTVGSVGFPNSGTIFAAAVCLIYLYRAIIIVPRFIFEAHDSAKDE